MRTTVEKMQWLARLNEMPDISRAALKVAIALSDSLNCKYQICNPSNLALQKSTGLQERAVSRGIKYLVENGLISRALDPGKKAEFILLEIHTTQQKTPSI